MVCVTGFQATFIESLRIGGSRMMCSWTKGAAFLSLLIGTALMATPSAATAGRRGFPTVWNPRDFHRPMCPTPSKAPSGSPLTTTSTATSNRRGRIVTVLSCQVGAVDRRLRRYLPVEGLPAGDGMEILQAEAGGVVALGGVAAMIDIGIRQPVPGATTTSAASPCSSPWPTSSSPRWVRSPRTGPTAGRIGRVPGHRLGDWNHRG